MWFTAASPGQARQMCGTSRQWGRILVLLRRFQLARGRGRVVVGVCTLRCDLGSAEGLPEDCLHGPQKLHNPPKGVPDTFWKPPWCLLGFLTPAALDQVCNSILWGCLLGVAGMGGGRSPLNFTAAAGP